MSQTLKHLSLILLFCLVAPRLVNAQAAPQSPDLTQRPTLYVVGYAHLDTQWRWEYPQVIREYLTKTMYDNFRLFEKYPHYIFNFTGANRYRMLKEYYPADYAKVKRYIAEGRWFPAGSSMEEGDVNAPSAESLIRQILYGNEFFRREFGKASAEYMLPDCFGFPASLPSILAHAGIKGFSTQKLTWGSSAPVGGAGSPEETPEGTPFNVGIWDGPDGRSVLAALNPGSYTSRVTDNLSDDRKWLDRVNLDGKVSGLFTDYHYYGTGDTGGAPAENSVKMVEESVTSHGPLRVVSSDADQMFLDILKSDRTTGLPHYKGDLELTNHSAGSLTSEAYQKRWNRKNELLADAAEKASVAAAWLGGRPYPLDRLNRAWALVMGGQFHDIMAGTATPKAYEYSWNDDVIAMNQFADVLTDASAAVASGMNTEGKGISLVVYNPLAIAREDVVAADLYFPNGLPKSVRVVSPTGRLVPAQVEGGEHGAARVVFLARVPPVGYAIYNVQSAERAEETSPLKVTESSLENARYRIELDKNGDVSSILDNLLRRELLSAPLRLAFQQEKPEEWPAWNMDWADQQKPPRGYVGGPAKIRIVENGPARVALEVRRDSEGSHFVQTIRLSAGDAGNRVEFANSIDWATHEAALKATFPLTASNPKATYNWGVGTIQRGNNDPKKFEVASHQWFDLTDKSGAYGVTILTDCKNGSDKPSDNLVRLTLLYSPGISARGRAYSDQATQDWGHHEFVYGLAAHAGGWRKEETDWQALRLNDPLIVFETPKHAGPLGKSFSLLQVNNPDIRVMAVKRAEKSDAVVVRLVESGGTPQQDVRISFAGPIADAQEINGQEQQLGAATVSQGQVVANFTPYQIHSFAVKLAPAQMHVHAPESRPVTLTYDRAVASGDGTTSSPGFDAQGQSLPAEMLPQKLDYDGIVFHLAAADTGKADAVVAHGQKVALPPGRFNRVYILAAADDGDQEATFRVGDREFPLNIENWGGYVGQWDDREWNKKEVQFQRNRLPRGIRPGTPEAARFLRPRTRTVLEFTGVIEPGFIKRAPIAWFASHRHTKDGANEPYSYSYLFAYTIDTPADTHTLTLPDNDKIRVLAITVAEGSPRLEPGAPLYDALERSEPVERASR